jgi:dTDP-4-dehydrorhamnose reductase
MSDVVVMGASGMLGSMVADLLSRNDRLRVRATVRSRTLAEHGRDRLPEIDWTVIDVDGAADASLLEIVDGAGWVINAVGVIKPYIHDDDDRERERALRVNSLFPYQLARIAERVDARIIQIATDCVFSGDRGRYTEDDPHDAVDAYGMTKSLGEVRAAWVHHLRCSIVGPELTSHVSLLDWFLGQPANAEVKGFTNHVWNGITTLHFARICEAIVTGATAPAGAQHVVPAGAVTKADLLKAFADTFERRDIEIRPAEASVMIDRTLDTVDVAANRGLWDAAGYGDPPTVQGMLGELAAFDSRFRKIMK